MRSIRKSRSAPLFLGKHVGLWYLLKWQVQLEYQKARTTPTTQSLHYHVLSYDPIGFALLVLPLFKLQRSSPLISPKHSITSPLPAPKQNTTAYATPLAKSSPRNNHAPRAHRKHTNLATALSLFVPPTQETLNIDNFPASIIRRRQTTCCKDG